MTLVVYDDLKRAIKQLQLIERQLLDGKIHPLAIRQPLQAILQHEDPNDLCECGHIRAGHRNDGHCSHSISERHEGRSGMRGSTTRPCPCFRFRLAQRAQPNYEDIWVDSDPGEARYLSFGTRISALMIGTFSIVALLMWVYMAHSGKNDPTGLLLLNMFCVPLAVTLIIGCMYVFLQPQGFDDEPEEPLSLYGEPPDMVADISDDEIARGL